MRILRVCPTPGYTKDVYKKYGKPKTFKESVKLLREKNVLLPGGWKDEMEALGHEVFETSYDDHYLQGLWAHENCALSAFSSSSPSTALLAKQIDYFKPDVLFLNTGVMYRLNNHERSHLRALCNHTFKCVGFWGDEVPGFTNVHEYFGDLDFMLHSNQSYADLFNENGVPSAVQGSGFDERLAKMANLSTEPNKDKVLFAGDTGYLSPDHINRYEVLDELMEKTNMEIHGFQRGSSVSSHGIVGLMLRTMQVLLPNVIIKLMVRLGYRFFPMKQKLIKGLYYIRMANEIGTSVIAMLPQQNPQSTYFIGKPSLKTKYPKRVKPGAVDYTEYLELLSSHLLNINVHRDEHRDYGNIRCYEITGVGSLLFSDRTEAMAEFFEEGKEFVGFETTEDLIHKINYFKKHPDIAMEIAKAGQKKTLENYTLRQRCKVLHDHLLRVVSGEIENTKSQRALVANYNLSRYPISYDFAFFLECALTKRRQSSFSSLQVNLILPKDIKSIDGVSKEADDAVDSHGRLFRINHICSQIASVFPLDKFSIVDSEPELDPTSQSPLYNEYPHHSEFYAFVNNNSADVRGFRASEQARRYAKDYLSSISAGPYCTITLRYYEFDKQRNSNLPEWQKVINELKSLGVTPIIVPDTDQFGKDAGLAISDHNIFWPGCFDVDLRYGLYEECDFNFFVNNGPATLASLNKNVNFAVFKLIVPGVPHCTKAFIERQGYKYGETPEYCTDTQHWYWVDDTFENIKPVLDKYFSSASTQTKKKLLAG